MRTTGRGRVAVAASAVGLLMAGALGTSATPAYAENGVSGGGVPHVELRRSIDLPQPLNGQAAIDALGLDLALAAALNELSVGALTGLLLGDSTAWIDIHGKLFFVDPIPEITPARGTTAEESSPGGVGVSRAPTSEAFALHSKPGSQRVIFLDFDGATVSGTGWNSQSGVGTSHPAWTLDGDAATFNDSERLAIINIWERVAEDYAPFDVDVTTQDPGDAAITRTNASDPMFGTRVLITPSADASLKICQNQCGGVAYLDVFDATSNHAYYQPAWIFPQSLGPNDPKAIAEAASHEAGHNLGLSHDGNATTGYYGGHGVWAPIMGVGYNQPVTQWSKGEYTGASQTQDDLAIISGNGAPYRADEAPGTLSGATFPTSATSFISTTTDVDVWDLGTCTGSVTLDVNPVPTSPNLDIELQVIRPDGTVVATVNPAASRTSKDVAAGLSASYAGTLASGAYLLRVDGVGNGTANTGYTDYASLGGYTITHSGCTAGASVPGLPQGLSAFSSANGQSVGLSWSPPASNGGNAVSGYVVQRVGAAPQTIGASPTTHTFTGLSPGTTYTFTVSAVNLVGTGPAASIDGTTNSAPGAPTAVTVTTAADGTAATVTWTAPTSDGGTPVTSYTVGRTGASAVSVSPSAGTMSRTWTGLTPGSTYTFTVAAVNGVGTGAVASEVSTLPVVPEAPTNLQVTAATNGQSAVVSWTAPVEDPRSPRTGYRLQRTGGMAYTVGAGATSENFTGLTPGATYTFSISAINAVGTGAAATTQATMPNPMVPVAPGAPTSVTATMGANGTSATLTWSPPASDGGSAVTTYTVQRSGGSPATVAGGTTTHTFNGLTRGTTYTFTVTAANAVGSGPAGSTNGTTPDLPGTPSSVSVTPAPDGQSAELTWGTPSNGGSPLTGYTVQRTGGSPQTISPGTNSHTFSGLTPGSAYTFTVTAVNAVGSGSAGSTSATMPVPATAPGVPTSVSVSAAANGTSATLTWAAPASNGGSAITGYTASRTGGSPVSLGAGATSTTFTGLTPGSTYTFSVAAVNAVGTGPAATGDATLPTVPGTPSSVTVTVAASGTSATVSWAAPASNGGSAITGYTASRSGGSPVTVGAGVTSATFSGLAPGASYTFSVAANNAVGTGAAATQNVTMANVPGTPTSVSVTPAANGQSATLTWAAPSSDGGSAITGYTVQRTGASAQTLSASATSASFTGLTPGSTYTFTVAAVNGVGTGANGSADATMPVPATVPSAPTSVSVSVAADGTSATLTWAAPSSNGGSAVTGYTTSRSGGSASSVGAGITSKTFTGLTPGTTYTFSVSAVNSAGAGPAASVDGTTPTTPGTPTSISVTTASNGTSATLNWAAPTSNGGSVLTGYTASRTGGSPVNLGAGATSTTFTGLTPGTTYTFSVAAKNAVGTGSAASQTATTPDPVVPTAPGKPTSVTVTAAANGQTATLAWSPPTSDGGSAITGYLVQRSGAAVESLGSSAREAIFSGLTPGATYTFTVSAMNAVGTGAAASVEKTMPVPPDAPGAPADLAVSVDHAALTAAVTWSPPASDGGAPVTGYQVIVDSVTVATVAGTAVELTDLERGHDYELQVRAVNSVGPGLPAEASFSVADAPGQPTALAVTPASDGTSATLTWSAPTADGGSPVTGYVVGREGTTPTTVGAAAGSQAFTGLTPGATYTFTVAATNDSGTSDPSTITATMPTSVPTPTIKAPSAPRITKVTPGKKGGLVTAGLTWTAPTTNGGAAIAGYRVTAYQIKAGKVVSKTVSKVLKASSTKYVMKLKKGFYKFAIVARNSAGWGAASGLSPTVKAQ